MHPKSPTSANRFFGYARNNPPPPECSRSRRRPQARVRPTVACGNWVASSLLEDGCWAPKKAHALAPTRSGRSANRRGVPPADCHDRGSTETNRKEQTEAAWTSLASEPSSNKGRFACPPGQDIAQQGAPSSTLRTAAGIVCSVRNTTIYGT